MIRSKGIKQMEKKIKADAAKESDGTGTGLESNNAIFFFFGLEFNVLR